MPRLMGTMWGVKLTVYGSNGAWVERRLPAFLTRPTGAPISAVCRCVPQGVQALALPPASGERRGWLGARPAPAAPAITVGAADPPRSPAAASGAGGELAA